MAKADLVSVIILTWNGIEFIEGCLQAVLNQTYPNFEVIVVDNASTDGTAKLIAQQFPTVRLIKNAQNLGFAAGINVGLTTALGEFLVPLNQDTVVDANWIAELIGGMLADDKVGIGGCKILNWSGDKIWHAGVVFDAARQFPSLRGAGEADEGQYDVAEEMPSVVGAAFAIRRELLESVGLFDENYYFYLEDTDYCFRARQAGYKVMYYPRAVLRHYVAASLKKDSYKVYYQFHRSRLLFILKHRGSAWFYDHFVPAEIEYLKNWVSLNEFKALRHACMALAFDIAKGELNFTVDSCHAGDETDANVILRGLADLRNGSLASLIDPKDWYGVYGRDVGQDWHARELLFRSNISVVGFLIEKFRYVWSMIAAKWIERHLLSEQNRINDRLIALLEVQTGLISTLHDDIALLDQQLTGLLQRQANRTNTEAVDEQEGKFVSD